MFFPPLPDYRERGPEDTRRLTMQVTHTNSDSGGSGPTCSLVVTTIGRGEFLADYYAAILREGANDRVSVIVIPDRRTPTQLFERCAEFARRGMRVQCPTLAEQECYLARWGFSGLVPHDSDNRRNVGFLIALEAGSDFVISIDDDNYCRPAENFFSQHAVVAGGDVEGVCVNTSERFFNICDLMEVVPMR